MAKFELSRRRMLQGSAAGILGLAAGGLPLKARAAGLTVGIVYVGPRDDFGWNQAHAVAAAALKEVPGVTVVEEENVPETIACAKSMESMINLDGAELIFATSFGYYKPFVLDLAAKYPDIQFRHAAPLWSEETDPKNAGSYFGYMDQAHYVDGIAAGLCTKSNKVGFVAAKPIAMVLRNLNSFTLGVKKSNPNATVQVIFTGEWSAARARGGGRQRAGGCRLRRAHLPCRQPEGGDRDRRTARHQVLRPQRLAGPAGAERLYHRRRIQVDHHLQAVRLRPFGRQDPAELHRRRLRQGLRPEHGLWRRRHARGDRRRRMRRAPR